MTVKELREELELYPDDAWVMISDFLKTDKPIPQLAQNITYLKNIKILFIEGGKGNFGKRSDKE